MTTQEVRFRFGQNWKNYARHVLDEAKLRESKTALESLTGNLQDKTFLDIGCGSGLQTVSAALLGASRVYAIDIDVDSIDITQETVERFAPGDAAITVEQASVLSEADLQAMPVTDVVYSWGVLHHTGEMWQAIRNAATRVNDDGLFVIAIYNKHVTSPAWTAIKWTYNNVPRFVQRLMYYLFYGVIFAAKFAATRRNPLAKERGMDFGYDVWDWIGGYPYEYASIDEITQFVEPLGFETVRVIPAEVGTGCNEFVFRRT
jgi:2-polyprenyl-6-hydroxyphenyl methylase/3-demethylubiquinone-9 3-methyltransferase